MTLPISHKLMTGLWISSLIAIFLLPGMIFAQPVFSFSVVDLEAYNRSGNWVYDADNPGMNPLLQHDGNHFTFGATSGHYYSEKFIHNGVTPGFVTTITCLAENTVLANNPGEVSLHFDEFDLVAFRRINTVDITAPWNTIGEAGDERIYSNATGYVALNGVPKLYVNNATFVITTPYPTQAQIRMLNPILSAWIGDIGTGTPQTGWGFADIDRDLSDDAWEELFASSDYKMDMSMTGIIPFTSPSTAWFDFTLDMTPSIVPRTTANAVIPLGGLPNIQEFPAQNVGITLESGTAGGSAGDMNHFYVKEISEEPSGTLPGGLGFKAKKYWQLGTTMATFNADLRFYLDAGDFAKAPADWRLLYRPIGTADWSLWVDYVAWNGSFMQANNITEAFEFAVASPLDETLPVELSSFSASVSSQNLISLAWSTASETSMMGFNVHYKAADTDDPIVCLTPVIIPATNSSTGSSYSFVISELSEPGTYSFYLEPISLDGSSMFYGPVTATLGEIEVPGLPLVNTLGDAWPNPFNMGNSSNFKVEIKDGENGIVTIYNLAGQTVKTFEVKRGVNDLSWNGMDSKGNLCASGVYFFKLSSPSLNQTKKLMLVK